MNKDKHLIIFRRLPGSGKTTLAELFCDMVYSADDYFMEGGEYIFDASKLGLAHAECKKNVEDALFFEIPLIGVANTFTTEKEMKPYQTLGEQYGYKVHSVIVENRRSNSKESNIHNVPIDTIAKMRDRFNIKLG